MAMRQRKKPSRMTLSKDVSRSSDFGGMNKSAPGPFGGMNQTEARVGGRVISKPRAAVHERRPAAGSPSTRPAVAPRAEEVEQDRRQPARRTAGPVRKEKNERPMFHALKMQATLTPLSYNQRAQLKEKLAKIESFEQFGLRPDVQAAIYTQALPGMTDVVPTPAQKLAIPKLLSQKGQFEKAKKKPDTPRFDQFLIAAETGSGKTLAYLLPTIDAVKRQEEIDKIAETERKAQEEKESAERNVFDVDPPELADSPHSTTGRPRALILLPSSELVTQVGRVIKTLGHAIKYRSAAISSSHSPTVIRNRLFNPSGIDIVISTPHLISSIAEKEPNVLSRVQHLVVDEADSLLDRSFSSITCGIIDRAAPTLKQLVLCSATIPRSLDSFMDKRFPQITRLVTPKLHSIPRRVVLGVVDIDKAPYQGNRSLACADIIWQIGRAAHDDDETTHTVKSMLVFVNEREKAEEVAKFLSSKGVDAVPLTRDTPEQRQSEILSTFTSASRIEGEYKEAPTPNRRQFRDFVPFDETPSPSSLSSSSTGKGYKRLPNTKVLVTTDLGSRGIDTLAVRHVILYDVPHTTIDFVHRLGRTGRMGRRGRGVVLVGKNDRKDIVREVKDAMFKGHALI